LIQILPSCPSAEPVSLLGVDYSRLKTNDGGDLYLTRFGLPFLPQLAPENWYAPDWFAAQRVRLKGTSTIYRVPTKPVNGLSLNLVVRFSRMAQEIPLAPAILNENAQAEFNSPFEEFALLMQLRAAHLTGAGPRIFTKKPLAIFQPPELLETWQTGRLESKMAAMLARYPETRLDMRRQYLVVYGWIKGLNALEAAQVLGISGQAVEKFLWEFTLRAIHDMEQLGFRVVDMKPEHIVLRILPDGSLLRLRTGRAAYALIDYELLERIPNPGSRGCVI
jgi:hypothetical protein